MAVQLCDIHLLFAFCLILAYARELAEFLWISGVTVAN